MTKPSGPANQTVIMANGAQTVRRVMSEMASRSVPVRINPVRFERGYLLPGEPLYIVASDLFPSDWDEEDLR